MKQRFGTGRAALGAALLALAGCLGAPPAPTAPNGVTAHRGDSLRHPENTLEAFAAACDAGADWVETDVRLTADGELVLSHNPTTGATCGQDLVISNTPFAELARLDVAATFRARRQLTRTQCPPRRIVRLEEALELILARRRARLSIQPKCACVDQVMALVRRKGALAWVGFNDGSLPLMRRVKELEPSVPVFYDRWDPDVEKDIAAARRHGFETLVPNSRFLTREKVRRMHDAGLQVGVWTVNDPGEMRRFLDMGVDRIYTDAPQTLLDLLAARRATP